MAGKHALVTAAGQGIGAAVVHALRAEGATVVATDINAASLAAYDGLDGVSTAVLDVTDSAAVESGIGAAGEVDVLVNVAGFVHHGSLLECTEAEWDFAFDLNVKSMYRTIRACLPGMLERGGGSVVNIASVASSLKGVPVRCAYGSSKAAVLGLTKSVAADYVMKGIRCNAICPGTVQSPSLDDRIAAQGDAKAARAAFIARQPMGRLGEASEIAAAALHFASDESGFTTGTFLTIDGGMTV